MAISKDGFIAGTNDETPWSDIEWQAFKDFVTSCDVVLLGKRTYEIMKQGDEFIDGPKYMVVTSNGDLDTDDLVKINIQTPDDLPKVARLGIIGGGDLNGRLAELDVIDEIILDTEPIELKSGVKLFGEHDVDPNLELISTKELGANTIQTHYRVIKKS